MKHLQSVFITKKMSGVFLCLGSLFLLLFLDLSSVQAAEIYFGHNYKEVTIGEKFEVGVFLATNSQSINALEGEITFSSNVEFDGVLDGGSIVSLWVHQPRLANGRVSFSGVFPGGFTGEKGYLFSLIFKGNGAGLATLATEHEKILLNDGAGTQAVITKAPLSLKITDNPPPAEPTFVPLYDNKPPELFTPKIARDDLLFSGKWFLSFLAQDKESGIDHYELLEKPQPGSIASLFSFFKQERWVVGQSPYPLVDQSLKSVILVKALDRAGNVTVQALPAQQKLGWYQKSITWCIIIPIAALLLFLVFVFNKMPLKRQEGT